MFGSLYDDEPDDGINDDLPFASATRSYRYRPDNCASLLEMPDQIRDPREFSGLKNQGATCYMNSYIQTLYMIHDFRNAIFKMPLCKDKPETPSEFLSGQKYQILYSLQKLFVQLKAGCCIAASTVELTESFGWKNNQQMVQHDVQDMAREFLGVLDRALKGTVFENLVSDTFKGIKSDVLQVPEHNFSKSRDEDFADILLQVRGMPDLETSLREYFNFVDLSGDNQYA
jgi:ubiquitin C-terminal hydrolase